VEPEKNNGIQIPFKKKGPVPTRLYVGGETEKPMSREKL
jgi:hypothetical protein